MGCEIACLINGLSLTSPNPYTLLFWQFHSHWYLYFFGACWLVGTFGSVSASQAGNQTPMPSGYASFDQVQTFEFFFAKPATHSLSQMAHLWVKAVPGALGVDIDFGEIPRGNGKSGLHSNA